MSIVVPVESYQKGWVCPICGRVYSPSTMMCLYCGGGTKVTTKTNVDGVSVVDAEKKGPCEYWEESEYGI